MKVVEEDVIELLKRLIEINSVNPFSGGSGEAEISNFIADYIESSKIEVHTQKVVDDRYNVVGILRGEGDGPSLMLNGHIDTVGVKGMTIDPFRPSVKNGNVHGRGSCDMKGGIAGMMTAMKVIANSGVNLRGDLLFSGVVDEEYMSQGTEKLIEEYRSDATLVGEPTNLQIGLAHKGFVWAEVKLYGKSAHGSVPEKGADAIAHMADFVQSLYSLNRILAKKKHPLLGSPTIHASTIEGGTEWSMIPDFCQLRIERRTVPGEDSTLTISEIADILDTAGRDEPIVRAKVERIFERQPLETSVSEEIVKCLATVFRKVLDADPVFVGVPYWSDAALFSKEALSSTCLLGPGDISLAHSPDEYVDIAEVCKSARIYVQVAKDFCGTVK